MEEERQKQFEKFKFRIKTIGRLMYYESCWKEIFEFYGFKWEDWWSKYCRGMTPIVGNYVDDELEKENLLNFTSIWGQEGEDLFLKWLYTGEKKYLLPFYEWFKGKIVHNKEEYEKEQKRYKEWEKEKGKIKREGYIYILKSKNLYKIGRALNLENRFTKYQVENPFGVEMVFSKKVKDYIAIEEKLLKKFSDKKIKGEWFKLNKKDLKWIKENL